MTGKPDKYSFILGMITAFCECVAGGCKRLALSPPLTRDDYSLVEEEARAIIEKHGLTHFHERNLDQPESKRVEWIPANSVHTGYDAYKAYFGNTENQET